MPIPRYFAKGSRIIERTFTGSVQLYRKVSVVDNTGGQTDTYEILAAIPCSYYRTGITPVERENATQVLTVTIWTFVFAAGTDIRPTDRLYVPAEGRTFEVVSFESGSFELARRVTAQEIT